MDSFEYLLAFTSILVGLAVADLATSLHRLLRARRRVKWDWLPLTAAAIVLLLVLQFWWSFFLAGRLEVWARYDAFLLIAALLMTVVLLASAALPDTVPEDGLDMRAHYEENAGYFWTLFAVFMLLSGATNVVPSLGRASGTTLFGVVLPNLIVMGLLLSLAIVRRRMYHIAVVLVLLAATSAVWFRLRLVLPE